MLPGLANHSGGWAKYLPSFSVPFVAGALRAGIRASPFVRMTATVCIKCVILSSSASVNDKLQRSAARARYVIRLEELSRTRRRSQIRCRKVCEIHPYQSRLLRKTQFQRKTTLSGLPQHFAFHEGYRVCRLGGDEESDSSCLSKTRRIPMQRSHC